MPRPPSDELVAAVERRCLVGIEAVAVVDDLDREPVGLQLVRDLDVTVAARAVRMPHRVRHRFGQRELEVGHHVVGDLAQLRKAR